MGTTTGKPTKPSKPAQQGIEQTNPSNTVHKSQVNITIEVLTVNLFFDGTKNNKYNIDNKTRYSRQIKKDPKGYESYTNAYSNVAHLYEAAYQQTNKNNTIINIYVEGMGTTKDRVDDQQGFAMGSGITGITRRANHAFETMRLAIQAKRKEFTINRIRLNAFGFSRGAATARHFLSNFKGHRDLGGWGIGIPFRVNFVGLFDTVSSFDSRSVSEAGWDITKKAGLNVAKKVPMPWTVVLPTSDKNHFPEFNDDVVELDLTLDTNKNTHPLKVFQICAKDEYRTYFSLTDIKSAKLGGAKLIIGSRVLVMKSIYRGRTLTLVEATPMASMKNIVAVFMNTSWQNGYQNKVFIPKDKLKLSCQEMTIWATPIFIARTSLLMPI
ncbi:phospholipase effector Tle1 domain-containing protein [Moraxella bovis]|uniref:phospholipase effector Tle1 domain-containing protein n=1 Tax=Moraxella bovis TaxID=476 RepID=UPI0023EE9F7D|nr:DUF2235 domain-containing protein [Moraxella bovis]